MEMLRITDVRPGDEEEIGKLLILANPYVFSALLGTDEDVEKAMRFLMEIENSPFAAEHIRVARSGGAVVGVCVRHLRQLEEVPQIQNLNLDDLPDGFADMYNNFVSAICKKTSNDAVYVTAIATAPNVRRRGIGSALINEIMWQVGREPVLLETLFDNKEVRAFSESLDFEVSGRGDTRLYADTSSCAIRMVHAA